MSNSKRKHLEGRGPVGKTAVVGAKDRATNRVAARVVDDTTSRTLHGFVGDSSKPGAKVYTDEPLAYDSVPNREAVKHSLREFVRGEVHTNGIESFWSMLKRATHGNLPQDFNSPPSPLWKRFGKFQEWNETRFEALEGRLDCVDGRLGGVEKQMRILPKQMMQVMTAVNRR